MFSRGRSRPGSPQRAALRSNVQPRTLEARQPSKGCATFQCSAEDARGPAALKGLRYVPMFSRGRSRPGSPQRAALRSNVQPGTLEARQPSKGCGTFQCSAEGARGPAALKGLRYVPMFSRGRSRPGSPQRAALRSNVQPGTLEARQPSKGCGTFQCSAEGARGPAALKGLRYVPMFSRGRSRPGSPQRAALRSNVQPGTLEARQPSKGCGTFQCSAEGARGPAALKGLRYVPMFSRGRSRPGSPQRAALRSNVQPGTLEARQPSKGCGTFQCSAEGARGPAALKGLRYVPMFSRGRSRPGSPQRAALRSNVQPGTLEARQPSKGCGTFQCSAEGARGPAALKGLRYVPMFSRGRSRPGSPQRAALRSNVQPGTLEARQPSKGCGTFQCSAEGARGPAALKGLRYVLMFSRGRSRPGSPKGAALRSNVQPRTLEARQPYRGCAAFQCSAEAARGPAALKGLRYVPMFSRGRSRPGSPQGAALRSNVQPRTLEAPVR